MGDKAKDNPSKDFLTVAGTRTGHKAQGLKPCNLYDDDDDDNYW